MMEVASCQLDGNADAVEFCPHQPYNHILAAATYTLEEGTKPNRSGSISLFAAHANGGLTLLHCIKTVGVFDIRWNRRGSSMNSTLLAQAGADGCLALYSLQSSEETEANGAVLTRVCSEKISAAMCLCVDWNSSSSSISLGLSDGSVSIVSVGEAQLQVSWLAHEYEVWTTAFDTCQSQLVYTGSDDCRFSCWDLRQSPSTSVFQNTKAHQMGVCCIAQGPTNSNMLLTGSYDEHLRVWDLRLTSRPVSKHSLCLGGGVWRIKHHPYVPDLVLAACMHNGFAIVKIGNESSAVVESYAKHESLAYGADWQRAESAEDVTGRGSLVVTCSFYDRLLRLWQPECMMVTELNTK